MQRFKGYNCHLIKIAMKFYFIFFLLLLTACTQENNQTASSNQIFPNEVGDQWVYKYDVGFSNSEQYIYVDIVGKTTLQGHSVTIWNTTVQDASNRKYLIDSSYVLVDNEKAVFYAPPCLTCTPQPLYEKRKYIFPLEVGNKWFTSVTWGDTTKVLSKEDVTVPAGTFHNTYKLSKIIGYVYETYTRDSIWLTPKIGMTRRFQNEFRTAPVPGNGIWELTSYNLK
jgi:hypothetical protein